MKKLIFILLTSMSLFARAERIDELRVDHPTASPYELLQMLYNESTTPAELSDFDDISASNFKLGCASATKGYSVPYESLFRTTPIKVVPAEPQMGPLFPPTPAKIQLVLLSPNFYYGNDPNGFASEHFAQFSFQKTATEFTESFKFDDDHLGISIRKNGNLIAIHLAFDKEDSYAYCYRQP